MKNKSLSILLIIVLTLVVIFLGSGPEDSLETKDPRKEVASNREIPESQTREVKQDEEAEIDKAEKEAVDEEEIREEDSHSKEVVPEDIEKRDWLGIHKLSISEESDKGYPYIILPADILNLSSLPDRGKRIRFDLFDGLSLSGSVLMSYEDDDRKSLGALLEGESKLYIDYDSQGVFQNGFILSDKEQLSYLIMRKDDGKLEIKGIELGEVFPDETGILPPDNAEGDDNNGNSSGGGGVKKSFIQGSDSGGSESDLPQGAPPVPPTTPAPLADTFKLHSRPGANHTIYLDFNGHVATSTIWNALYTGGNSFTTPAYNFEGDSSFTNNELTRIQQIWARVAEDFISFDVNVTTEEPALDKLAKSIGTGDTQWGVRVAIGGSSSDWFGSSVGGIAYVGSFNWGSDTPVYCFPAQLAQAEKYVAECISHEVGHALGLNHHGRTSPSEEYYAGHGSGDTGWAPIMGNPYHKNLTHWSRGDYVNANRFGQDDVFSITNLNGFGYRADDSGNTPQTATALAFSGNTASRSGIIETNADVDVYSFTVGAGLLQIDAVPGFRGPNVDLNLELLNSTHTVIASSNPADLITSSISQNVAAGTYYVRVSGSGKGTWSTGGYSNYGSIGSYHFNVVTSVAPPENPSPSPSASASTSPSSSPSSSPSASASVMPSASASVSASPSASKSPSPSASPSASASASPSASASASVSASPSASASVMPSASASVSASASANASPSPSSSPSPSASETPVETPSPEDTETQDPSPTPTPQEPDLECEDPIDFTSGRLTFKAGRGGRVDLVDQETVRLFGNSLASLSRGTQGFSVDNRTILKVHFSSNFRDAISAIGFNNRVREDARYLFQLAGSRRLGVVGYHAGYPRSVNNGEIETYEIPVGEYYTGFFSNLLFLTKDRFNSRDRHSTFKVQLCRQQPGLGKDLLSCAMDTRCNLRNNQCEANIYANDALGFDGRGHLRLQQVDLHSPQYYMENIRWRTGAYNDRRLSIKYNFPKNLTRDSAQLTLALGGQCSSASSTISFYGKARR